MEAKNTRLLSLTLGIIFSGTVMAQNVAINTTGALPNASAILDLSNSANLAFLPPQVALTNIATLAPVPAPGPAGLVVYSTSAPVGGGGTGLYFWDGAKWNFLSVGAATAWNLTGNAGTNPAVNYAGTSDPQPFLIKTSGTERMRFLTGGGAGIGTATPLSGVDINGSVAVGTYAGTSAAPANGEIISGQVGIGNSTPNASAILDLTNSVRNLGFLMPNMTTVQRNAIGAPIKGLMVFNNTTGCINFWTGFAWENVTCPTCTAPPAVPGSITGLTNPVISTTGNVYSIAPVPGSLGYTWSVLPLVAGTIVTGGQGTTAITVTFNSTVRSYTICVYDSNACGVSATNCLTVNTINCIHSNQTFNYSGGAQTWLVPNCITQITVTIAGAQGGYGGWTSQTNVSQGGNGGSVSGVLAVVGGTTLQINVGGAGGNGSSGGNGLGGWNGGAAGWWYTPWYWGGGGGGATDIRVTPYALANRVVVAGGGGGGAFNYSINNYDMGGPGGAATGGTGYSGNCQGCGGSGTGGTQLAGGIGGTWGGYCTASNGALGLGGADCSSAQNAGGGGGGGYYGGGGGCWSGGGGGSNYTGGLSSTSSNSQGTQTGNGFVTIQW